LNFNSRFDIRPAWHWPRAWSCVGGQGAHPDDRPVLNRVLTPLTDHEVEQLRRGSAIDRQAAGILMLADRIRRALAIDAVDRARVVTEPHQKCLDPLIPTPAPMAAPVPTPLPPPTRPPMIPPTTPPCTPRSMTCARATSSCHAPPTRKANARAGSDLIRENEVAAQRVMVPPHPSRSAQVNWGATRPATSAHRAAAPARTGFWRHCAIAAACPATAYAPDQGIGMPPSRGGTLHPLCTAGRSAIAVYQRFTLG
jgi:hypothetical protein